jgi:hypothetical protein
MNRGEVLKILKEYDFKLIKEGTRHLIYERSGRRITMSRGSRINVRFVNELRMHLRRIREEPPLSVTC